MTQIRSYNVVVTAAAPFKDNKLNPTEAVKKELPDFIDRDGHPRINIIKYPLNLRNVLSDMDMIPRLWEGKRHFVEPGAPEDEPVHVDAMIHMGMAVHEAFWAVESMARRDGYDWIGDDGVRLPKHNGGPGQRWEGCPEQLRPMYNVHALVDTIKRSLPDIPVHFSDDAGQLYCEFIFYTSLATLWKKKEDARVTFYHVPGNGTGKEDIDRGVEVLKALICAMVDYKKHG